MAATRGLPRHRPPARQRGIVSALVAVLLIVGVIFILAQTLGIVGTRAIDTGQQLDSTDALMLAESGLQRAQGIVGRASSGGAMVEADCTGAATGGPFSLGRGTFSYATPVADPPACGGATPCNTCGITVTGNVGSTARTLSTQYNIGVAVGTTGRGQTVTMVLRNTYDVPAISLFNLAWKRQDPGGNADATFCANGATDCGLRWNEESSNGNTSVGGMGVTVGIPANTLSKVVIQTLSQARDYVEVGALFPSTSSATSPTVTGNTSYWDDKHVSHLTAVNNGVTGGVNSGVANGGGACSNPPTTYPSGGTGSYQADTCTNWCTGADTLVFGISGRTAPNTGSTADQLTAVTFNTNGSPSQNIPLSRIVHYPNLDGSTANASGKAYSEVWYAHNPDYMLPFSGLGATSYPAQLSGTVGATVNASTIPSGSTSMFVASFSSADNKICIGDVLTASGGNKFETSPATHVTATPQNPTGAAGGLPCSNQAGTYDFDHATTGPMNTPFVMATSNRFVIKQLMGAVTLNTPLQKNAVSVFTPSSVSAGDPSVYTLSTTPGSQPLLLQTYTQGASGTTILLPPGASVPSGTETMVLAVYSGTGQFPQGTTVTGTTTTSITVSAVANPGLSGAAICGGICAFFNAPSSTTSVTEFSVIKSANTQQWAGGFVCLKGVDASRIVPVSSTSLTTGRWQELVQ